LREGLGRALLKLPNPRHHPFFLHPEERKARLEGRRKSEAFRFKMKLKVQFAFPLMIKFDVKHLLEAHQALNYQILRRMTLVQQFSRQISPTNAHTTMFFLALEAWFSEVNKADWISTADVKRVYATASIVNSDRIVFNIKGNDYRLVVAVDFEKGIVWIKWIGSHKDYDRIDVKEIEHGK
jgi:mRNA interferase HigB